jgi:hypothetical protein
MPHCIQVAWCFNIAKPIKTCFMKKVMVMALALLGIVHTGINAQTTNTQTTQPAGGVEYLSLGPVIGIGDSWVGNMNGNKDFKAGGYAGVGLIYTKNPHWGWGAKALFSSEGYKIDDGNGYTLNVTPLYLRVPLDGYYFFGDYRNSIRPKVYLGPTFGAKLAENDDERGFNDGGLQRTTGIFNTFDLGLNAGAGLNIKLQKGVWLNMDVSYYQGLTDAVNDPAGRYNVNHNVAFNAGVLLGIR